MHYKVLDNNLCSGGVFGSKRLQYRVGHWVYDPRPLTKEPLRGGLFVLNKPSDAKTLTKKRPTARVFSCKIGETLRKTGYLTKTNKILLIEEL